MAKSKTGKIATGLTLLGFLFVLIAFSTASWLVTDGELPNPKFEQIGLWVVCFKNFEDPRHWYDFSFTGCWWVFEEEYYIIFDILLPGFFMATQFFFTLCFTLHLVGVFLVLLYVMCSREHEKYVLLQVVLGGGLIVAALSGTIAVYIFGAHGDGRDWMPNWEHNDIGYSYAMAVMGVICEYIAGTLFLVEGRVHKMKKKRHVDRGQTYHMEQRKSSHTTI